MTADNKDQTNLEARLEALSASSLDDLRTLWQKLYRSSPPPRLSRELLILGITWKRQTQTETGLDAVSRRKLKALAGVMAEKGDLTQARLAQPKPGARLMRVWQGQTHSSWCGKMALNGEESVTPRSPPSREPSPAQDGQGRVSSVWTKRRGRQSLMPRQRCAPMADASKRTKEKTRCAIYTRKSSEDGLEQDFNSLDAQREACEAYIKSQKQEGWIALSTFYDDGGLSGGSMKRPRPLRACSPTSPPAPSTRWWSTRWIG